MHADIAFVRIGILAAVVAGLCACSAPVPLYPPFAAQPPLPVASTSPSLSQPPAVLPPSTLPTFPAAAAARGPQVVPVAPAILAATGTFFALPLSGPAVAMFDDPVNPGIDIAGHAGDPIFAARDGRVVLVSSALPNYGTMVVLKHDDMFITAYAHLGNTLVREGDEVSQGQQIAELGSRQNAQAALHFEIRKTGVPIDPELYFHGVAK